MITPPEQDPQNTTESDVDVEQSTPIETGDVDFEGQSSEESNAPLTRKGLIQALKKGVANGILSKNQAAQIRYENNITGSEFTKNTNRKQSKHKRKLQKNARKVTRRQGQKGQKNGKGKGIKVNY